jgi:hypothetical protein
VKAPPKISTPYYFRNGFYDSLLLSRHLYPEILALSSDPGLYDLLNDLAIEMVDSNMLDISVIRKYKDRYIQLANKILALPKEEKEENSYRYSSLVRLLGKINLPETNEVLHQFEKFRDKSLRLDVILALAENNQPQDKKNIYTLATTDEFRSQLYNGLKKFKKETLFPKDYLSQKLLGQSEIFSYATEEDEPEMIEFITEKTEMFMGKKQKFYIYKVIYDFSDPENCYTGVAGPYSLDTKDYTSTHDVTGLYWDEVFDKEKVYDHLKELIKQAEDWLKKQNEDKTPPAIIK